MPRRKSDSSLNHEEFLEGSEEPRDGDGDAIVEIFRGVKARQEDESNSESNGSANLPSTLVAQNQEDQWDGTTTDEKTKESSDDASDDSSKESDKEDSDWEPETETVEVLDDPVRMYLREIGRVRLLTSKDERSLARKIEGGKHLTALQNELTSLESRQPRPWEITCGLLRRLIASSQLLAALGEQLGLPANLTLSQVTDHPKLRAAIDAEVSPEMLAIAAESMGEELEGLYIQVVHLS